MDFNVVMKKIGDRKYIVEKVPLENFDKKNMEKDVSKLIRKSSTNTDKKFKEKKKIFKKFQKKKNLNLY